jgi:Na+-driven multidrug efflux pump
MLRPILGQARPIFVGHLAVMLYGVVGGGRHRAIGAAYVQGLWLAVLLSLAGGAVLAFPEPWLAHLHAPPEVEALVTRYLPRRARSARATATSAA